MNIDTIYLFGSTGMLGNYVKKILTNDFNVICVTRCDFDILIDNWKKLNMVLKNIKKNDVIVNCAGIIPQKTQDNKYKIYIKINALFPHKLQNIVEKVGAKLIHISTDCVFNGKKNSPYNEDDIHTEKNIYGITKSLGEPENATVIRTSIIGEELKGKKSLLEWVKSNKNKTINGYSNHLWNGVTCLTLANIIHKIIFKNKFWKGIKHFFSPNIVSKYELCCYISKEFNLNININKMNGPETINKTLSSIYKIEDDYIISDISNQIKLLKTFTLYI